MTERTRHFTSQQLLFKEMFVGTLIYAVVLGFFNDYTVIVDARSFSTIVGAAIVLELLTCLAFALKKRIIALLKGRPGTLSKIAMFFCVWFVMFISKFVFIWAIDVVFGNDITIHGFFGILLVVAAVTIVHKLADVVFIRLGDR